MTEKLTAYDPAATLTDDQEIPIFLADARETGDASFIAKSPGLVACVRAMAPIADETGLSRDPPSSDT
ncbi:MAG TPA: transcriptional regulator [Variovorax sp.]|nr:transcriptional regulator [Variovorax sp.]